MHLPGQEPLTASTTKYSAAFRVAGFDHAVLAGKEPGAGTSVPKVAEEVLASSGAYNT